MGPQRCLEADYQIKFVLTVVNFLDHIEFHLIEHNFELLDQKDNSEASDAQNVVSVSALLCVLWL